ncbi:MAG: alpha/beta fold hydrolase [Rhizomicrobium sp.]
MTVKLVLLHSPLVGPRTWRLFAPLLRARGYEVAAPDYSGEMAGNPPYYSGLVRNARRSIGDSRDVILIAHSGAGALIPAVADAGFARGAIFMDALLPHPGRSWFSTAPDSTKSRLESLACDGRVPPWHQWWPKGSIEALFDDPLAYEHFSSELNDLPLAYFDEAAPSVEPPERFACAYLQLGRGYDAEAATAERMGWPVRRLTRHHLAMLTHPNEVAVEIEQLVQAIG